MARGGALDPIELSNGDLRYVAYFCSSQGDAHGAFLWPARMPFHKGFDLLHGKLLDQAVVGSGSTRMANHL